MTTGPDVLDAHVPHRRRRGARGRFACRAALVLALVVGAPLAGVPVASAVPVDAWPSADGGPAATRWNPGEAVLTPGNAGQVQRAWAARLPIGMSTAPAIVAGVAYHVVGTGNVFVPSAFTATSVRTGATLWTLRLPVGVQYLDGVSVSGGRAVVSFDGHDRPGGVLAVDLPTRRVAWTRYLPAPVAPFTWMGTRAPDAGPATVDGGRVYVTGSSNAINAYRLTDGVSLWRAPLTSTSSGMANRVDGIAAAGTVVYTGGAEGVVAYDAATGRRLWTGPGSGAPVVTGGRVLSAVEDGVVAVAAAGCGRSTCSALWRTRLPYVWRTPLLGGADGTTAFVTWVRAAPAQPGVAPQDAGMLARLSVATGAVQWSTSAGTWSSAPVRAGGTVWARNATLEYRGTSVVEVYRLMAWPAAGTGTAPLRTIPLGEDRSGVHGGLAVGGGTVVVTTWPQHLDGFRVPGT